MDVLVVAELVFEFLGAGFPRDYLCVGTREVGFDEREVGIGEEVRTKIGKVKCISHTASFLKMIKPRCRRRERIAPLLRCKCNAMSLTKIPLLKSFTASA